MRQRVVVTCCRGLVEYTAGSEQQLSMAAQVREAAGRVKDNPTDGGQVHQMLLLQHHPVYTTGLRATAPSATLPLPAPLLPSPRGGLITFHGPGQLVLYPVLHLPSLKLTVRSYVAALERCVMVACGGVGVAASTCVHTGVWVGERKICALGVQGRRVTTHGLALNCNIDLSWFSHIVPCGIPDRGVTSLSQETGRDVTVGDMAPVLLKAFEDVFGVETVILPDPNGTK